MTTPIRRFISLFVGASLVGLIFAIPAAWPISQGAAFAYGPKVFLQYVLLSFALSSLASLVAITLVAAPIWLALERFQKASFWAAGLLGGVLPVVVLLAFLVADELRISGSTGWDFRAEVILSLPIALVAALVGVVGCVAGLVMWRYAYRLEPVIPS